MVETAVSKQLSSRLERGSPNDGASSVGPQLKGLGGSGCCDWLAAAEPEPAAWLAAAEVAAAWLAAAEPDLG